MFLTYLKVFYKVILLLSVTIAQSLLGTLAKNLATQMFTTNKILRFLSENWRVGACDQRMTSRVSNREMRA